MKLGAVYTREWVAEFILDLSGYTSDLDLAADVILEPSCGDGAFLGPIIRRLITSARAHGRPVQDTANSLIACDIDPSAVRRARATASGILVEEGVPVAAAYDMAAHWIRESDFLLDETLMGGLRWIVGNPPYVRIEEVDTSLAGDYRARWTTMRGRADLYVGFFEAALALLAPDGRLAFICADGWMKNQYGARLRALIKGSYSLDVVLDLHAVNVFEKSVGAYPAITLMSARPGTRTAFAKAHGRFGAAGAAQLVAAAASNNWTDHETFDSHILPTMQATDAGWAIGSARDLDLITSLEHFPELSTTGVTVGSGVATGADESYILRSADGIESSRLLRLVGPADLRDGEVVWGGRWLINTWDDQGLISLASYPLLADHLLTREALLRKRYVGRRNPDSWWRTIDRPKVQLYVKPKLLVADIKDHIEPVLDTEGYAPMHSLYFLQSDRWDLKVLGGLLMSDIVGTFLAAYSVRMAGSALRVSSQYLKRIRVPVPETIHPDVVRELSTAFRERDRAAASRAAARAYGLD